MAKTTTLNSIQAFLAQKRFAIVGLSRDPHHFSGALYAELLLDGYRMVPVNPETPELFGQKCYPRVQDIQPPVDSVMILTPPEVLEGVLTDCLQAGVRRLWIRNAGKKADGPIAFCRGRGMDVIVDECPFMFLPKASGVHHFHGFLRKIVGSYPRTVRA